MSGYTSARFLMACSVLLPYGPTYNRHVAFDPLAFEYLQDPAHTMEIEPQLIGVDVNIVRDLEGSVSTVYWPGGNSGPTIGVGIDLGHAGAETIKTLFAGLVDKHTMAVMLSASGVRGYAAKKWVSEHSITLADDVMNRSFTRMCRLYWQQAVARFGQDIEVLSPTAKGVILSLVINHGPRNPKLTCLIPAIKSKNEHALALSVMEIVSKNRSIRHSLNDRRKRERDVLLASVEAQRFDYSQGVVMD